MIIASCQHEISIEWFNNEKSCIEYNDFDNGKKVIISSVVCPKCRKKYERKGMIIEKLKQPTKTITTMEKQLTAIEFMFDELSKIGYLNTLSHKAINIIQQAKALEKQQIIDAYSKGNEDGYPDGSYITGEKYYNNNFKK